MADETVRADDSAVEGSTSEFDCPRCGTAVVEEFYGPCALCRKTLRVTVGGVARDVDDVAYEPKMNVTPNSVAQKD